jgi:hypothetical protein
MERRNTNGSGAFTVRGMFKYAQKRGLGGSGYPDLTLLQGHKILNEDALPPFGRIVSSKPGYLESPYAPFVLVDVNGLETGTLVIDPLSKKGFVVPEMQPPTPVYGPPPGCDDGRNRSGVLRGLPSKRK